MGDVEFLADGDDVFHDVAGAFVLVEADVVALDEELDAADVDDVVGEEDVEVVEHDAEVGLVEVVGEREEPVVAELVLDQQTVDGVVVGLGGDHGAGPADVGDLLLLAVLDEDQPQQVGELVLAEVLVDLQDGGLQRAPLDLVQVQLLDLLLGQPLELLDLGDVLRAQVLDGARQVDARQPAQQRALLHLLERERVLHVPQLELRAVLDLQRRLDPDLDPRAVDAVQVHQLVPVLLMVVLFYKTYLDLAVLLRQPRVLDLQRQRTVLRTPDPLPPDHLPPARLVQVNELPLKLPPDAPQHKLLMLLTDRICITFLLLEIIFVFIASSIS